MSRCQDKNECTIPGAFNSFYGNDPCGGVSKYLNVTYDCVGNQQTSPGKRKKQLEFSEWIHSYIVNATGNSHYKLWVETDTRRADTVYFQIQFDTPVLDIEVNDCFL